MEFYIYRDGQQLGPYSIEALQDLLRLGSISSNDLAWREGLTDWRPLRVLLADLSSNELPVAQPAPTPARPIAEGVGESRRARVSAPVGEATFATRVIGAFDYPLKGDGVVLVIGGGVLSVVTGWLAGVLVVSLLVVLFVTGYVLAYGQKIIESSASGDANMPTWPDFSNIMEDILAPYFQFLATTTLCVAGPFWLWRSLALGHSGPGLLVIAWMVMGLFCLPMAWLAVTMYNTVAALNPILIARSISRVPGHYLLTVVVLCGVLLAEYGVHRFLAALPVPILSPFLSGCAAVYFLAVLARVLGLLYFVNRARLGWFKTA
ncbi:MAG: DUF4339 domain-containing protein [Verrucomicrobia bacterium]|nr:DUF4339 domain-containing protein [Verrucomicrobiota bacterium]